MPDRKIEILRRRMHRLAERYGLSHPKVLKQSQLLDRYIVEEQRRRLVS